MNTLKRTLTAITAAFFLLGCSGAKKEELNKDLIGKYELIRIDGGSVDDGISSEEVDMLKEFDLGCTLEMKEDGTAVMDIYGEPEEFIWNNEYLKYSNSEKEIAFESDGKTLKIQDAESEQALVFEKK